MSFDSRAQAPLDIAIIGSGIAGLSAAWLLSQSHRVTLYERQDRLGGHTDTVDMPAAQGRLAVDNGFIVYNPVTYPNLVALFRHLGVETKASSMSFSVSVDDGAFEYSGTGLGGLLAQPANLLRPDFWRMVRDVRRFYGEARCLAHNSAGHNLTLGQLLDRGRYSPAFVDLHLLPMAAAIWSTPAAEMRDYPADAFVRFFANHGLLQVRNRPQWRTVVGGSRTYVRHMTAAFASDIRTGTGVVGLRRLPAGVVVRGDDGGERQHDHAVVATHADEALALLTDADGLERRLLGAFAYTQNEAVMHSDPALMPRRRRAWSSWNYLSHTDDAGRTRPSVTYWMNSLQGIDPQLPVFVTLNPSCAPRPETVIRQTVYSHPGFDRAALAAQKVLWQLQGRRRTWFCGSYFGAGFHEDALQAGLAVAEDLGAVARPWRVADDSGRIVRLPVLPQSVAA
jgi:predicted NAD/FAD-binding protein